MSEPLQQCLDDLSPLVAGEDAYGKYLICRACFISYRVPGIFNVEDWQRIYDAKNPPSEREQARRRVKAFLEARRDIIGTTGGPEHLAKYPNEDGRVYHKLYVADLELLIKEEE